MAVARRKNPDLATPDPSQRRKGSHGSPNWYNSIDPPGTVPYLGYDTPRGKVYPGVYELLVSGLPPRSQLIWNLLASHRWCEPGSSKDGRCNVSIPTLAAEAHCGRTQVVEALGTLRTYGWLRQGRKSSKFRFRPLIGRPLLPLELDSLDTPD